MINVHFEMWAEHDGKRLLESKAPKASELEQMSLAGCKTLDKLIKADMLGPKSGRFYRIDGRLHQASINRDQAESPAVLTGALMRSMRTGIAPRKGKNIGRAFLAAGRGLPRQYAFYLEYGAPAHKMAPRALLRASADKWRAEVIGAVTAKYYAIARGKKKPMPTGSDWMGGMF